jgi:NADH:ubiquinone oxidoreductase subunit E
MSTTMTEAAPLEEAIVDETIAQHPDKTGDVLSILEELQQKHPLKYIPSITLEQVARKTGLSRSQILSVVTFYAFFNLKPQGRNTIAVCRGTACHTRGSRQLLDTLKSAAGFNDGSDADTTASAFTTPDYELTVRTVACFGQCAMAPVVARNENIYGQMTDIKVRKLLSDLKGRTRHENQRS